MTPEQRKAYETATYLFSDRDGKLHELAVGKRSLGLEAVLRRHNANSWAIVTAYNPDSKKLLLSENVERQFLLEVELQRDTCATLYQALGFSPRWGGETSVLVVGGIDLDTARGFGRKFGQAAILYGDALAVPRVISCAEPESIYARAMSSKSQPLVVGALV